MDTTLQDPLVGREVDGRYLIESRIAHGGMANVYLALDRRLDREVAFKVLYEHLSTDAEFVSRFVREARAAARLSHPNAVQVFDQGSDGPVLYLAMEYLPGRTLRDVLIQRGALTPRESLSVMEPVLGALGAAHRAGIVHRDVKPENVILTDDGRIKVADFGLARAVSAPMTGSSNGQLIGTVAYLAPELVSRGVADARADVYAAGILLFELLTGKQPFTGDDPLQVAYRHVHETVPRPSEVSAGVTSQYDDLVLRATNRDPDLRQPDADAFLAELRAVTAGMPDDVLDVRAAEAQTLRMGAQTMLNGAPAAASGPQATRALAMDRSPRRAAAAAAAGGLAQLVPRLRINDDDGVEHDGFFSDPRNRMIAIGAAIATLLVVVLVSIWYFASGPGAYIKTPPLVPMRVSQAQNTLTSYGLKSRTNEVFNDDVPRGQVVSTDPAANQKVRKGGTVTLNVSKGPDVVAVPDLTGMTVDEAKAALTKARLTLGKQAGRYTGKQPKGKIISSAPLVGVKVKPNDPIGVFVSNGPALAKQINVVGQDVAAAKAALDEAGFDVKVNEVDGQPGGPQPKTVMSQNPPFQEGQTLPKGTTITLTVIKEQPAVNVPDERGKNIDQAVQELQGLGFQVTKNQPWFSGDQVRNQSVVGTAPYGSTIILSTV